MTIPQREKSWLLTRFHARAQQTEHTTEHHGPAGIPPPPPPIQREC